MTLAAAWLRKVHNCEELVFISDSRLCGGHRWDECPKLMTFSREDCALAFAGNTDYAYPMMMQVNNAMSAFVRIRSRAMDIRDLNGHVLKHINHLAHSVYDRADVEDYDENEFIFGGFSWVDKEFLIWKYYYDKHLKLFTCRKAPYRIMAGVSSNIHIIGDQSDNYKKELRCVLQAKYGQICDGDNIALDMEPFQALCNMLRKVERADTIGGAPQMIKVYQFMNSRPVGVYWPNREEDSYKNRTLLGRKLFDYEDSEYWFMDPDTYYTQRSINKVVPDEDNDSVVTISESDH